MAITSLSMDGWTYGRMDGRMDGRFLRTTFMWLVIRITIAYVTNSLKRQAT